MQTTANYGLKKPEGNDTVDIDVINGNMDSIDGELKKLSGAMGDDPDFKTTLSSAISAKTNQVDFNNHVNALTAHGIGDRTQLKTAAKDTIVNALNELKTAIPSVPVQSVNGKTGSVSLGASDITISDSSNHFSSNPKNVENVLAELFTSGTNGKNDIYNAISAKGTTPASKNFSDLVSAIGNISTGKKFASGTSNLFTSYCGDYDLHINTLNFTPSIVICIVTLYNLAGTNPDFKTLLTLIKTSDGYYSTHLTTYDTNLVTTLDSGASLTTGDEFNSTGFWKFIISSDRNNGYAPKLAIWFAIE